MAEISLITVIGDGTLGRLIHNRPMVSLCLAIVGSTLVAPSPQNPPYQDVDLAAYLQHEDANLRKRTVIILADAVLSVRQPHTGDPEISPPQEKLFRMRASELPTLFDYLREYWKQPPRDMRVHWTVMPASQYEQLHRFIAVLRRVSSLEGFDFDRYVDVNHATLSKLALAGVFLRYNAADKTKLAAYLAGNDPIRVWAEHAAAMKRFTGAPPLPVPDEVFFDDAVNKWAYDGLVILQEKGLLIGYNFRIGHVEHHTRYSITSAINSAFVKLDSLISKFQSDWDGIRHGYLPRRHAEPLRGILIQRARELNALVTDQDLELLLRMIREFKWDLVAINADPMAMRIKIRDWIN